MKNVIESVLVIAYNPTYCKYFINNGEQHLCNYDKLRELLMGITPTLALQIEYFIERKLSFFISVNELNIQEVGIDLVVVIDQMKKDKFCLNSKNINEYLKNIEKDSHLPKYQKVADLTVRRFFKH